MARAKNTEANQAVQNPDVTTLEYQGPEQQATAPVDQSMADTGAPEAGQSVEEIVKLRGVPSDDELRKEFEERTKVGLDKRVVVRTASGGDMWDPEHSQHIDGKPTLATRSSWIDRQLAAGKLIEDK